MNKNLKTISIALAIALSLIAVAQGYYLYQQHLEISTLFNNYVSLQDDFNAIKVGYARLDERHILLESDHKALTSKYSSLQLEYDTLISQYDVLLSKYDSLMEQYKSLNAKQSALQSDYNKILSEYAELELRYSALRFNISDPTYNEAIRFIQLDQTNQNIYTENYTCENFAADFKNNAFKDGLRCGYVAVNFPEGGHAIVCFNTTDHGLIFVEPQYDQIVTLIVGGHYCQLNNFELPDWDDTIVRFIIIW